MSKYLFLLDIDGTILKLKQYHSKSIFRKCINEIYGIDVAEDLMPNFSGMTDLQIIEDICTVSDFPKEKIIANAEILWYRLIDEFKQDSVKANMVLLPETDELIKYLHSADNYTLALVTGNFKQNAYLKLQAFELHNYFAVGAFGCEFADRNLLPPLAMKRANERYGNKFKCRNTIVIGDSPKDIECAKQNNMMSVAVCTGFHTKDELSAYKPDIIFDDFSNYKEKVEEIIRYIDAK